ncbi:MAG TPA: DUF177 domain-containing protein [Candidatus Limnocylindrales bacterium]|jgi:uncharacterized protein|nr:DUF177 domain-containing protein [Candidatus Limnocylindrales bacterium]
MTGGAPREPAPSAAQPLLWNVGGLLAEGAGAIRDYAVEGVTIDLADELRLATPIDGRVHLAATNRGLVVDADFSTSLALECVRCLREIEVPIEVEIHEEALPSIDFHTGQPVHPAEGDDEDILRLTDHHELDLERAVREAIFLAEPIAPLDREDCPGLCVICGLPLDEGDHDHPDDDIDPRLEGLRAFMPD